MQAGQIDRAILEQVAILKSDFSGDLTRHGALLGARLLHSAGPTARLPPHLKLVPECANAGSVGANGVRPPRSPPGTGACHAPLRQADRDPRCAFPLAASP